MNKLLGIPIVLLAIGISSCGSLFDKGITDPNDPRILNGKFTGELVDWGGGVLDSAYHPSKNLLVNAYRNGTLEVLSQVHRTGLNSAPYTARQLATRQVAI